MTPYLPCVALCLSAFVAAPAPAFAQQANDTAPPAAPVERRINAEEADQGVASDGSFLYAIDNARIGKYRLSDGRKVAEWKGDPALYPHINSCTMVDRRLMCAASNYPAVPQTSSIEIFDPDRMAHVGSVSIGMSPGSLTTLTRHDGHWWATFANYDGHGGEPGRDHRYTLLAQLDEDFRIIRSWTFPENVLARFAPRSCSGASWGADGRLYVSGHDRPEIYALELPEAGSTLKHVATWGISTEGQAIDWDPKDSSLLWSIDRPHKHLIGSRMPMKVER